MGFSVDPKIGNALPLWHIPLRINIHNIEIYPGSGRKIARSAGIRARLIVRKNQYTML